ncbi:MAG: YwaF family protein [Clostridia bacterium]|nr:YwaF family protein [Clostridia bacterium]
MRPLEFLLDNTPRFAMRPAPFGLFHLASLAVILTFFVLMVIFRRRLPRGEENLRRGLMIFGIGLLLLEVGKQITYSYDPTLGWAYNWDRFPFQFCSTPIYIALVAICLPDGQMRRALLAFLATYSPVAGGAVLFYPAADVFHEIVFLNIHTVLWHGAMLLFGLYLWLTEAVTPSVHTALTAAAVYLPMPVIALLLNELEMALGFAGEYTFNMFYISRDGYCMIPVLSWFQQNTPYPVFFAAYVLTLGVGGALVTAGMGGIRWLWSKRGNNEPQP